MQPAYAKQLQDTAKDRERLIIEHLPQVRWIAASIHDRLPATVLQEDLVSAGIIGLIAAIDNFDPTRNTSLRTYAEHKIRGAILDGLRRADTIPSNRRRQRRHLEETVQKLEHTLERRPEDEEIAASLGIDLPSYHALRASCHITFCSLDAPDAETSQTLLDTLPADTDQCPKHLFERSELERLVSQAMTMIPPKQARVLDLLYLKDVRLTTIAKAMGVNPSRVFQIKKQALVHLRQAILRIQGSTVLKAQRASAGRAAK